LATDNLLKIIDEEGTDILCIQEQYMIRNKIVGSPQSYKVFASGEGRKWAAIVINNKQVDTILINQLSDEVAVVLETKVDTARIIIASMYFDGPPLWSSGQSFWLQIQRSRVRFPALPDFLSSSGSGTGPLSLVRSTEELLE